MVKLRAAKDMKYGTRRLRAGDEFDAPNKDAKLLIAIKQAHEMRPPAAVRPAIADADADADAEKIAAAATPATPATPADELAEARAAYREAFGKAPYHTWDVATLRQKIAAAKGE